MGSSLLQWDSDPLFSAAEVVQDSADRMESIFRLLWHEQSLVQVNNYDPMLLTSIGYHRRDLATILETAKWQLEDFERAVNSSATMDRSRSREDVVLRHKEFISAIREQINNVEKSLEEMTTRYPAENSEWKNVYEQDNDGLALFLSGGIHNERNRRYELDDASDMFKRFLDPTEASCSDAVIVGKECGEIEVITNGIACGIGCYDSMEGSNVRKVDSQSCIKSGLNAVDSYAEDGSWDLEASEGKPKRFFLENKLRGSTSGVNLFWFFNNLRTAYGSNVRSGYTKRLKDGEEEQSPSHVDASGAQGRHIGLSSAPGDRGLRGSHEFMEKFMHLRRRLGACKTRFDRISHLVEVNRRSIQMILAIVFALTLLDPLLDSGESLAAEFARQALRFCWNLQYKTS